MPLRAAPLTLVALLCAAGLSGCFGASDDAPLDRQDDALPNDTAPDAQLPDDRGTAIAYEETNRTEEGAGGVEHKHDYWRGRDTVEVFVGDVSFSATPVYPDGQGSSAKSVAYVKLPQPQLVYEGTGSLTVTVNSVSLTPHCALLNCSNPTVPDAGAPHPSPPSLSLRYRTAADDAFLEAGALTVGAPLSLPVAPKQTDMPHSVSSLWAFAIVTGDRPDPATTINMTVTAHKGAAVADWPGHPEFYADRDERVVFDDSVVVHRSGIEEGLLYGAGSTWIRPQKLVSYGTGYVDVFINVTRATSSNGAPPTGFFLEYHDATILDAEDRFNDRIDDEKGGRAFTDSEYHFVVPVSAEGMDGPYQPSSRWGFRLVATFAETPVASLCPGCFPYDIEYTMRIVAHKGEQAARINE